MDNNIISRPKLAYIRLTNRWCGKTFYHCSSPACQLDYSDGCDGNIQPAGLDTKTVPRPKKGSVPYGQPIYHCELAGRIALSYDDGPFIHTEHLLNLLSVSLPNRFRPIQIFAVHRFRWYYMFLNCQHFLLVSEIQCEGNIFHYWKKSR